MNQNITSTFSRVVGRTLITAKSFLDTAGTASRKPFVEAQIMTPRWNESRYSWTHYGLFFSDLPEPHRFLNIMILFGTPSALAFDHDYLIQDSARRTATVFSVTAACEAQLLKAYVFDSDCHAHSDGSDLKFGSELTIEGKYPNVHLKGSYIGLEIDIKVDITNQVSWFLKNFVYDHFSLLAKYQGTIIHKGDVTPVSGLCTYEYARSFGLYSLTSKTIPMQHKIPLNFFTYQILKVNNDTQLLLTKADVLGIPACYCVHVRKLGQYSEFYDNVEFKVIEYHDEPKVGLDGYKTKVPKLLTWQARDALGNTILSIMGISDTDYYYGHGRGYATSYRFDGEFEGKPVTGRCYMEYVDVPY